MTEEEFKTLNKHTPGHRNYFSFREVEEHYFSKGYHGLRARLEIGKIKVASMIKLQKFRAMIGRAVFFNCITDGIHSKDSQHPKACAYDIRIGGEDEINWNTMIEIALECGFKGIGFYPFWNTPGLHLDDRKDAYQLWTRDVKGEYVGLI